MNPHPPSVLRRNRKLSFAFRVAASQDAPDQPPFVPYSSPGRVHAAVRWLKTVRPAKPAHEPASDADPPRRIELHDSVRALEPEIQCDVSVNDPLVGSEQGALFLAELVLGRRNPTGLPPVEVETYDGMTSLLRERFRKRALARAGHAGDDDTTANSKRQADLAHDTALMVCLSAV
jgi:hypothetical protein